MTVSAGAVAGPTIHEDSVQVYFAQGSSRLDPLFGENGSRLRSFASWFNELIRDGKVRPKGIRIVSTASPEGSVAINDRLAKKRADAIVDYMYGQCRLSTTTIDVRGLGVDWSSLATMVREDSFFPYKEETMALLATVPEGGFRNDTDAYRLKVRLSEVGGGVPWHYMEEHFYPKMRRTMVHVVFEPKPEPEPSVAHVVDTVLVNRVDTVLVNRADAVKVNQVDTVEIVRVDTVVVEKCPDPIFVSIPGFRPEPKPVPFYMSLRTNLLTTVALVPNIGVEFYLRDGYSLLGSWSAAWWKNDRIHTYWRIYGGEVEVRRYLGKKAQEKPLQGHHLGLYGQWYSWDFEVGKWHRGYQSADGTWSAGLNYGYALPIGRRFNLDLEVGMGYLQGIYQECLPQVYGGELHYVWQATRRLRYFGPTKVGVTLTWLLGYGNYNKR